MRRRNGVALTLLAAMFAGQAAIIAMAPVLDDVAAELGVDTATAGQLRTLSALVAALVGFRVPSLANRVGLRAVLLGSTTLLAIGALLSAAASSFAMLAAAQALLGVAAAGIVVAATAAAGAWAGEHEPATILSWAFIGQPAAWIVGMPLVGALGSHSWRLAWLCFGLPAAAVAGLLLLLLRPPRELETRASPAPFRSALADRAIARWGLAELLFNCGWSGTLVYAGTLFADSYDSPKSAVGLILGGGAVAYVCGTLIGRRCADRQLPRQLVLLASLLCALVVAFGAVRPGVSVSVGLFVAAAFVAGWRTLAGGAIGLSVTPDVRLAAMSLRTAAVQVGGVVGAGIAGVSLAAGSYEGLGLAMAALLAGSAAALVELRIGVARVEALGEA